jgi:hypothetical protein
MARDVEQQIRRLIAQGKTKGQIYTTLSAEMERDDFERFLRNHAERSKQEAYQGLNLLLLFVLAAVTFFRLGKVLDPVVDHGIDNMLVLAWSLLVPAVNCCLLWLIYRFHRLGYLFLFCLSALSLLRPETRSLSGILQTLCLLALSGFLYLKLFPKGGRDY